MHDKKRTSKNLKYYSSKDLTVNLHFLGPRLVALSYRKEPLIQCQT